eukprot:s1564_g17.t1
MPAADTRHGPGNGSLAEGPHGFVLPGSVATGADDEVVQQIAGCQAGLQRWQSSKEPRTPPAWAGTMAQRRDELDAHLGLTTPQPARSDLHRAVRGMPEIADRLTERWARKTERGLPSALTEYKD